MASPGSAGSDPASESHPLYLFLIDFDVPTKKIPSVLSNLDRKGIASLIDFNNLSDDDVNQMLGGNDTAALVRAAAASKPVNDKTIRTAVAGWLSAFCDGEKEAVQARKDKLQVLTAWGHISLWNTSKVTNMVRLFQDAKLFNSDLSGWDVSQVVEMGFMFRGAEIFKSDLSNWNVSKVRSMNCMFYNAKGFDGDLSRWKVSQVKNMAGMFGNSSFNGDISAWDVAHVQHMGTMFYGAKNFNGDLSGWNVSKVQNMWCMFQGAERFTCDLSRWNTKQVLNMDNMFTNCPANKPEWPKKKGCIM